MSSFIDMMADHDWSDADIFNRCEQMKRSEFSDQDEQVMNRLVSGALSGKYTMTPDEVALESEFQALVLSLRQLKAQATADRDALRLAWPVEAAQNRLLQPAVQPTEDDAGHVITDPSTGRPVNQAEIDADTVQRATAQAVVSAASQATLDLCASRAAYFASLQPTAPATT